MIDETQPLENPSDGAPLLVQQTPLAQPPPPQPAPPAGYDSVNLSAEETYGAGAGVTTTTKKYIPGEESNPYIRDYSSSKLFQGLSPPNENQLRQEMVNSQLNIRKLSEQQQLQQTSGETPDQLISRMILHDEEIVSSTHLRVRKVSWLRNSSDGGFIEQGDPHIGVRAQVSNQRLLLIDSTLDTEDTLQEVVPTASFLFPARSGESYQLISRRINDIWFKPIPLSSITGLEIHSSHRATSLNRMENRVNPIFYAFLLFSIVSLLFGFGTGEGFWVGLFIFFGIICALCYKFLAVAKSGFASSYTTKSRTISIGYYDSLLNIPVVMTLELEDSQNLSQAYQWCRCLQDSSPRLSDTKDPLILL